ncbi:hypothetical protein DFH27DRAFT_522381 [Peziza echinospora]|nr:hypothetical protein DFH27DRAFT_522381 [Peziza echinospora]
MGRGCADSKTPQALHPSRARVWLGSKLWMEEGGKRSVLHHLPHEIREYPRERAHIGTWQEAHSTGGAAGYMSASLAPSAPKLVESLFALGRRLQFSPPTRKDTATFGTNIAAQFMQAGQRPLHRSIDRILSSTLHGHQPPRLGAYLAVLAPTDTATAPWELARFSRDLAPFCPVQPIASQSAVEPAAPAARAQINCEAKTKWHREKGERRMRPAPGGPVAIRPSTHRQPGAARGPRAEIGSWRPSPALAAALGPGASGSCFRSPSAVLVFFPPPSSFSHSRPPPVTASPSLSLFAAFP